MTLTQAFDQFVQIFNSGTGHTPFGSPVKTFDDLRPLLEQHVILRKAAAGSGNKKFFVHEKGAVVSYLNHNFRDPAISFDPNYYGPPLVKPDTNFVVGWVFGSAKWTDTGSLGGEKIDFTLTFINESQLPNGTAPANGDWKILFLYGSN
jgi:hypothetical protein